MQAPTSSHETSPRGVWRATTLVALALAVGFHCVWLPAHLAFDAHLGDGHSHHGERLASSHHGHGAHGHGHGHAHGHHGHGAHAHGHTPAAQAGAHAHAHLTHGHASHDPGHAHGPRALSPATVRDPATAVDPGHAPHEPHHPLTDHQPPPAAKLGGLAPTLLALARAPLELPELALEGRARPRPPPLSRGDPPPRSSRPRAPPCA